MLRSVTIVAVIAALSLGLTYALRAAWIEEKIAALSSPASSVYAPSNAALHPKGPRPRIILIGDSRIAQWPSDLLPSEWEVINRGVGGETTAQTVARFQHDALSLNADVILIETGINDLVAASFMDEAPRQQVVQDVIQRVQMLAEQAAASKRSTLIATILPPARPSILRRIVWNESLRDLVADVNASLRKATLPHQAKVFDLAAIVVGDDPKTLAIDYRKDTLHINTSGYEQLTSALKSEIQSTLNIH